MDFILIPADGQQEEKFACMAKEMAESGKLQMEIAEKLKMLSEYNFWLALYSFF